MARNERSRDAGVLIVEANSELGTFCCTHETWPQTLDSPRVGVSFAGNSPVIEDLDHELCERTFESDACRRQILMTPVAFRGRNAYCSQSSSPQDGHSSAISPASVLRT